MRWGERARESGTGRVSEREMGWCGERRERWHVERQRGEQRRRWALARGDEGVQRLGLQVHLVLHLVQVPHW